MATLYQRNMQMANPAEIENIFDTVNLWFIPIEPRNREYKKVLAYLAANELMLMDLDLYIQ